MIGMSKPVVLAGLALAASLTAGAANAYVITKTDQGYVITCKDGFSPGPTDWWPTQHEAQNICSHHKGYVWRDPSGSLTAAPRRDLGALRVETTTPVPPTGSVKPVRGQPDTRAAEQRGPISGQVEPGGRPR